MPIYYIFHINYIFYISQKTVYNTPWAEKRSEMKIPYSPGTAVFSPLLSLLSGKLLLTVFFGVDEKRRLCSEHSLLFSIFFFFLFVYFLISYPQYCITSSQNIAFAQENHSLV